VGQSIVRRRPWGTDEMIEPEEGQKAAPDESDHQGPPDRGGSRTLREFLSERYGELKRRLTRRLGSSDWAEEALHDTYLRLDGTEAVQPIDNPDAYLFRAAFNNALNRRRAENRRLSAVDIESLLHIADDAPGVQRILEARSDLSLLKKAMAALPARQRAILLAARLEGLTRRQIADRLAISVSMVDKELKKAQEHCAASFARQKADR
jgi:RNA polymerase sigma-70 factor, ECF subfamily